MKRVLIVDDAIDVCRMLQDALKTVHPEYSTSVVPSAEEALLEASRLTVDLLVTDVRLPGMSGMELVRKFRVRQPQVRVILMTGLTLNDPLLKQKDEIAPDVFLRKPMQASTFLDAVETLLGEQPPEASPRSESIVTEMPAGLAVDPGQAALLRDLAAVMPGEPAGPRAHAGGEPGSGKRAKPPAEPENPAGETLAGMLSRLRGALGAISTLLLDERGRPVAQAGDMPEHDLESQLIPSLMAAASAGARVAYLLGQSTIQVVQAYRGSSYDLVAAPVGQFVLLIVTRKGDSNLRLALAFEAAVEAQAELSAALKVMGLHIQSTAEIGAPEVIIAEWEGGQAPAEEIIPPEILDTPLGQDPGLEKFEALFARKKTGQLRLEDPDSFWDTASGESGDLSQPGVLSFEQALKLGLVPPEQQE